MKIEIEEAPTPKLNEFPRLMRHKENGAIVCFLNEMEGMCIFSGEGTKFGAYSQAWIPCQDAGIWQSFDGVIKLSN